MVMFYCQVASRGYGYKIKSSQPTCLITKNTEQNVNAKKGLISKNQLS